jgi:hypothetical protein
MKASDCAEKLNRGLPKPTLKMTVVGASGPECLIEGLGQHGASHPGILTCSPARLFYSGSKLGRSGFRLGGFRLGRARKTFYPFLVIAVERTGMLATDLLEEEGALLRLLG